MLAKIDEFQRQAEIQQTTLDALDEHYSDDIYYSDDIATTVYTKLGIPHDLIARSPDGRPVRLIEGKPIRERM